MNPIYHLFTITGLLFIGTMSYTWYKAELDPEAYGMDIPFSDSDDTGQQITRTSNLERVQRVFIYLLLNSTPGQAIFAQVVFLTICLVHLEEQRWRGWEVTYTRLNWFSLPSLQWEYRGPQSSSHHKNRLDQDLGLGSTEIGDPQELDEGYSAFPDTPGLSRIRQLEAYISRLDEVARIQKRAIRAGMQLYSDELAVLKSQLAKEIEMKEHKLAGWQSEDDYNDDLEYDDYEPSYDGSTESGSTWQSNGESAEVPPPPAKTSPKKRVTIKTEPTEIKRTKKSIQATMQSGDGAYS